MWCEKKWCLYFNGSVEYQFLNHCKGGFSHTIISAKVNSFDMNIQRSRYNANTTTTPTPTPTPNLSILSIKLNRC